MRAALLTCVLLVGLNQEIGAKERGLQTQSALRRLETDILSSPSATQTLSSYCAKLGLADPAVIHAVRDRSFNWPAGPDIRRLLNVGADDTVRYRRVRLSCGTHVLSDADNWYVPARLTAEMNGKLDQTDIPFGAVVKPLDFRRHPLGHQTLHDGQHVLKVRALLLNRDGLPFSLVQENYSAVLVRHH